MPEPGRIVRGGDWSRRLQQVLPVPPADMAQWMQGHTRILKSDAHSQVGLLRLEEDLCCLKFYHYKSMPQGWLYRAGRGRALRSFDAASQLARCAVPVPQARACLLVAGGALLLTQGIDGAETLDCWWRDGADEPHRGEVLAGAGQLLAQMHLAGYAHGDCKWRNILSGDNQLWLIDLDGAAPCGPGGSRQARDLARFTLDAEELAIGAQCFELFLTSYLQAMSLPRDALLRAMMPSLVKLRSRHAARYGERGEKLV